MSKIFAIKNLISNGIKNNFLNRKNKDSKIKKDQEGILIFQCRGQHKFNFILSLNYIFIKFLLFDINL